MLASFLSVVLELKVNIAMKKFYYYLSLGYFFLTHVLPCSAMTTTNITTDQLSLLALKAKITSDPSQILANNWSITSSVCDWIGVTCGSRHRRVTALDISNLDLDGTISPQLGNLSFLVTLNMSKNGLRGELPHELALLRRLRVLDLGVNNFVGDFPSWIGSLKKLQYLFLRNNSFTGFIPPSISNMSNLKALWLSFNSLQGAIPVEIGNLNKLKILKISYNQLSGSLPREMFNISSLEIIGFQSNSLSGVLPVSICLYLPGLTWLGFSKNKLSGMIPSTISQCSKLRVLGLAFNQFSGPVPAEFGNLTVLEELYLSGSNLNGTIPQELGNLQNLRVLSMIENSLIGSVPDQIFNISTLQSLELGFNNLSGNLPSTMGYGLINLEILGLPFNDFVGPIPASISNASNLADLDLSGNKFSGPIPNSLGDLRHLSFLILFHNYLITEPPSTELSFINYLTNCKYLRQLVLDENPLNGSLPMSVGNLSTYLEQFFANSCEIKGRIPEGIGNLSTLIVLSLPLNQLSGPISDTVKGLQNLQGLYIYKNQLSGSIPESLCELKSLYEIDLSQNQIQGSIPLCLSNITSLRRILFAGNVINSSIPSSLWNLNDLLVLDLSSNSLVGSLPQEIQNLKAATILNLSGNYIYGNIPTTIGDLQRLINLSLAQNKLEGPIPNSLSHMLSLQFLDLSRNNLSGSIPRSLENLSYLTYINLSFNNLRGEIPSDGPFKNFTSQSFMFNRLLCGAPRFLVPPCSTPHHKPRRKKISEVIYILLGILATIIALTSAILFVRCRRKEVVRTTLDLLPIRVPKRISYYELLQATNGYDDTNLLGSGSFGSVYKGTQRDGMLVAVKVFNLQMEGVFKSFDTECEVLRNLRHRNITKVIGCCSNQDFKALVLEYMCNGNLETWLHSHNHYLDLMQRLNIMIDVACGLQYLHCGYTTPVVHCDLKPSNILLDANMVAHVTDFGVAKFLDEENSILHTKTLATLGYIAPEYGSEGQVSTRTDVHSFGIILMETFSRMKPNDDMFSGDLSLKHWIEDSLTNNNKFQAIDANLLRPDDEHSNEKLECVSLIFQLALNCCTISPKDRINMIEAVGSLGKIKHQLQKFCEGT